MTTFANSAELDGSGPFYVVLDLTDGPQDYNANGTIFYWAVRVGCSQNGWGTFSGNAQGWSAWIDDENFSGTWALDFQPAGTSARSYLIASGDSFVNHNSDGTRQDFQNEATINSDHSSVGDGTVYTWADAPSIPRSSTPSWSGNAIIGTAKTLNTNRASSAFTHNITYQMGAASGTIGTGVGASISWTPPTSLLNQMPNAAVASIAITTVTKNGSDTIGTTVTNLNVEAAATVVPDFTTVTVAEAVAGVAANIGGYVQGISKLALAITGATGVSGSTISSYKIEVAGQTINAVSGTTPAAITATGTVVVTGTITDSRGRQKVKTVNITVLAYGPPAITALSVQRALSGGSPSDNGTYLRVNINAAVNSLFVGSERNAIGYRISTRLRGTSSWTLNANTAPGGVSFNSFVTVGTFSSTLAYDVLVEIYDDFSTTAVQLLVGVASIFMHWNETFGVGFGKYRERGRVDIQGEAFWQRSVSDWRALTNEGTAAERDAIYGVPATDAARVALANRKIIWYNLDNGFTEMYYAVTGLAGLTVRGLIAGTASGWYPMNTGPQLLLLPSASFTLGVGGTFINWTSPGTGLSTRTGGTAWFTVSAGIPTIVQAGRYDIEVSLVHAANDIMHEYQLIKNNLTTAANVLQWGAAQTSLDAWTRSRVRLQDWPAVANDNLRIRGTLGSNGVAMDANGSTRYSGEFSIKYTGPALVSE